MTDKNTITYNDKEYDVSDLNDTETYLYAQVRTLRKRIADARFDLDQLVMAENATGNIPEPRLSRSDTKHQYPHGHASFSAAFFGPHRRF